MAWASLQQFKSVAVYSFFVVPADHDYLLARGLLVNAFSREYFWHAAQSLGKYLKAGLVANGKSMVQSRHDLAAHYSVHAEVFKDLELPALVKPRGVSDDY